MYITPNNKRKLASELYGPLNLPYRFLLTLPKIYLQDFYHLFMNSEDTFSFRLSVLQYLYLMDHKFMNS
jgi:hypothetical protein